MELVRHHTTVIIQSYEIVQFHYMWLYAEKMKSTSGHDYIYIYIVVRWLCDLVRCRKTMAQHREKAVHMRTCENMVYRWKHPRRRITPREVARRRAMIVRYYTISGIATRFLNMAKNLQDVVLGPSMAATSYDIARLRTIHPRWYTVTQTSPIVGGRTMSYIRPGVTIYSSKLTRDLRTTLYLWEGRPMPFINIFGWEHV